MKILGIDPGLERIGFGLVEKQGSQIKAIEWGLIQTPRVPIAERLLILSDKIDELLQRTQPDAMAMERLFFAKNQTTVMDVAKACGVILVGAARRGLEATEYSPPEVKLSVVGNGAAEKKQVEFMVVRILGLPSAPKPDDVADALAIAVTHAMRVRG